MATAAVEERSYEMQAAVFGQNESHRLGACLASLSQALGARRAVITVILNGSTDGSAAVTRAVAPKLAHPVQLCSIEHGDKSNAINQFWYHLRVPAELYLCIDAYSVINPGAVDAFVARMMACPGANAASALAASGRYSMGQNAATLDPGGVLRGQCYAVRPAFLDRLTAAGLRLPLGIYWGDGLIGSLACHDLDAVGRPWDNGKVVGVAGAEFTLPALSMARPKDIVRQFRRKVRQTRGKLQNAAIKRLIYTSGYAGMPDHADDMVIAFIEAEGLPKVGGIDRIFQRMALRQIRSSRRPRDQDLVARTEMLR